MTKDIDSKNYKYFLKHGDELNEYTMEVGDNISFDNNVQIFFHKPETSLYKKKISGDEYEKDGDGFLYYEYSDEDFQALKYRDSYVKEEDEQKRKQRRRIGFDQAFCETIQGFDIETQKEEFEKLMRIDVDAERNDSLDQESSANLLFYLEDNILGINQKLIKGAIGSANESVDTSENAKYNTQKLQDIADDTSEKLQPFKVGEGGSSKYFSNEHIAQVASMVNIEMSRGYQQPVEDIQGSVDKLKVALRKFSEMKSDDRYQLMDFIQSISKISKINGEELGVGLGRTVKTRLKLNYYLSNPENQKIIKDLIVDDKGDKGLNEKELSALVILISKSIQLTNQGFGYHDTNNKAITLDQMHLLDNVNEYEYGTPGKDAIQGKYGGRKASSKNRTKARNNPGMPSKTFDPSILKKITTTGIESAIEDDDDRVSQAGDDDVRSQSSYLDEGSDDAAGTGLEGGARVVSKDFDNLHGSATIGSGTTKEGGISAQKPGATGEVSSTGAAAERGKGQGIDTIYHSIDDQAVKRSLIGAETNNQYELSSSSLGTTFSKRRTSTESTLGKEVKKFIDKIKEIKFITDEELRLLDRLKDFKKETTFTKLSNFSKSSKSKGSDSRDKLTNDVRLALNDFRLDGVDNIGTNGTSILASNRKRLFDSQSESLEAGAILRQEARKDQNAVAFSPWIEPQDIRTQFSSRPIPLSPERASAKFSRRKYGARQPSQEDKGLKTPTGKTPKQERGVVDIQSPPAAGALGTKVAHDQRRVQSSDPDKTQPVNPSPTRVSLEQRGSASQVDSSSHGLAI